jgi:hypothetical protein
MILSRKDLDVSITFERAGFEIILRSRLELFKENTLNGLLNKNKAWVCSNFVKTTFRDDVWYQ